MTYFITCYNCSVLASTQDEECDLCYVCADKARRARGRDSRTPPAMFPWCLRGDVLLAELRNDEDYMAKLMAVAP